MGKPLSQFKLYRFPFASASADTAERRRHVRSVPQNVCFGSTPGAPFCRMVCEGDEVAGDVRVFWQGDPAITL